MQATPARQQGWSGRPPRDANAPRGGLRRSLSYLSRQRGAVMAAYGALVLATLAQLAVPQLVQNMIDAVTQGVAAADRQSGETLLISAALLIVLFAIIRGIFSFVQAFMAEKTSHGLAFDLRNEIFSKVQRLSFSYYDQNQTGQLMIRATDDVERVRMFIAQGLVLAAQAFLLLIGALVILTFTNWRLTLVVVPLLPVALALFMLFGRVSQPLFVAVQIKLSALNTVLQENLAGIKVVRAFAREPYERQRFDSSAIALMQQQLRVSRVFSFLFPVIFLVAQLGQAAVLYFGGRQILGGTLNLGEYQKFSLYLVYVFFPLGQLGFIISLMSQASASASRIFEILDAKSDIIDKPGAITLPQIDGRVEFRSVTFRYFGSGSAVLDDVSFTAEPGQTIALLGLRSQIGIVLQETNLFSGTIRDNIAFGRPDATLEQVQSAAQAASAHDFIIGFPEGYDTPVGERGTTLSGGQKQRIAIARALLLNPRLLILDDSTSSVDLQTEYNIQKALDNLMHGRTSFVIAQRISTVLNADQILVLDKGQVAARGTHEELLESSPIYAEIYHSQLVGDAVAAPAASPAA